MTRSNFHNISNIRLIVRIYINIKYEAVDYKEQKSINIKKQPGCVQ